MTNYGEETRIPQEICCRGWGKMPVGAAATTAAPLRQPYRARGSPGYCNGVVGFQNRLLMKSMVSFLVALCPVIAFIC